MSNYVILIYMEGNRLDIIPDWTFDVRFKLSDSINTWNIVTIN